MLSSADQERSSDLFHEVPTQTRRSFATMNMANAAEALLIKGRIEKKSVLNFAANER